MHFGGHQNLCLLNLSRVKYIKNKQPKQIKTKWPKTRISFNISKVTAKPIEVYEKSHGIWRTPKNTNPARVPPPSPPGYALTLNVLSHSDGKMEVFFILELTDVEETKCTP